MAIHEWDKLADREVVEKTIASLQRNGIVATFVQSGEEAKKKILEFLPQGAEVMNMTSMTLETIGVVKEILESGRYKAVRNKLNVMDRKTQTREMQRLSATPEWTVGSIQAISQAGQVLIASNTGSQLSAYVYGADHVIWIVGTQKIVKDLDEGMKRIYEYTLPLEAERARKAYGVPGSNVSKLLIINKELKPGRINVIFVNEVLGF